jgi:hypothetical protein
VEPVQYLACTNQNAIDAWDKLILEDMPATVFTKDGYYRYSSLDRRVCKVAESGDAVMRIMLSRSTVSHMSPTYHPITQIRAVLETCAVEMTSENYTACHEREMVPVQEFAQQSPMQVQLISTYDAWAKELFACAEVRARMQATCTQTIIDSFKAEYVPPRLTILTRA